jgi:FkbM family methyltransferase
MTEVISRLNGHHEPQEELAFYKIIQRLKLDLDVAKKPVMIELGSFWAYYSLWFLEDFPDADVYCVEPDLNNLEVGKLNFESNSRKGTFIQSAIASELSEFTTFITESTNDEISVRTFRFEEFSRNYNISEVDILLLDIQGAELECHQDLANNLNLISFRYIFVSTHDLSISGSPTTHQDCLEILNKLGAHIIVEHSVSESFSGDGLIVASLFNKDNDFNITLSYNRSKNSLFGEWETRLGELMQWVNHNFGESVECKAKLSEELEMGELLQKEKILN